MRQHALSEILSVTLYSGWTARPKSNLKIVLKKPGTNSKMVLTYVEGEGTCVSATGMYMKLVESIGQGNAEDVFGPVLLDFDLNGDAKMDVFSISLPSKTGRNWEEDAEQENGNYFNMCLFCGHQFVGMKGRRTCKQCAQPRFVIKERPSDQTRTNLGTD